jgi:hypothetical protein
MARFGPKMAKLAILGGISIDLALERSYDRAMSYLFPRWPRWPTAVPVAVLAGPLRSTQGVICQDQFDAPGPECGKFFKTAKGRQTNWRAALGDLERF